MTAIVQEGVKISGSLAYLTESVIDLAGARSLSIYAKYIVASSAAKTFVVLSQPNDTLTVTAHAWATGRKMQASNSGGALPTGIVAVTDYFVIVVDANTIKLASSLANAIAGTAIDITGAGTGTQTLTPTALTACVINILESNDGTNWNLIPSMTASITVSATNVFKPNADSRYAKISMDMTAGQLDSVAASVCAKGE